VSRRNVLNKNISLWLKKEGVLYNTARADLHEIFHTNNKVFQAVGYICTKRRLDVTNYEFKVVD